MVVVIEEEDEQIINNTNKSPESSSVNNNNNHDDSDGFETASDGDEREINSEGLNVAPDDSYEDALNQEDLKQKALAHANDVKAEGNELFKDGKYEDALLKYEDALQIAPEIPKQEPTPQAAPVAPEIPEQEPTPQVAAVAPEMTPVVELRSICHSNRAACFIKLGKYDESVKECTKALELNPLYLKVLVRRGEALEKLERYDEAISDMKKILELDPSNIQARRNIVRLEPLAREKMEKMKEEMLGKLKEMGNSLLGRFGMSVDNFKAVQDPNTGSYSVSFQR